MTREEAEGIPPEELAGRLAMVLRVDRAHIARSCAFNAESYRSRADVWNRAVRILTGEEAE